MCEELWPRRRASARAWLDENKPAKGHAWSEKPYAYDFWRDDMRLLEWDELNPKKPIETRLQEACAAYAARFGQAANVIFVSEHDAAATFVGCAIRVEKRVRKDCYQVGRLEA